MNKPLLFLTVFMMLASTAFSQTFVSPGEGTLYSALEEAEDGDVLQLVPDALYTESTNFEFGTLVNRNITIEVEGDGSVKAKLQILTPATDESTPVFFEVGDAASLTLKGLEFDGRLNENPNTNYLIGAYMGEFAAPTLIKKLYIENCYIHNLDTDDGTKGHVISAGNSDFKGNVIIDSTMIENSIIENTGTVIYFKYAGSHFISIKNSTINTVSSYGIRISGSTENLFPEDHPTVVIDYTTWYNIGTIDGREIIQAEKEPVYFKNPWFVTNSIFVKQVEKSRTMINIKDTLGDSLATITNIAFWDIGQINFRSHTVKDTIRTDPQFADPDNGDFTLPVGSELLSYGTKGDAIGDPRWAENSTAVEHATDIIAESFSLDQNYPNPFNPSTKISFSIPKAGPAKLQVYDILGREVATLLDKTMSAGNHEVNFDGVNLNAGIYFYRLQSEGQSMTRKMMLIK
jgi:hypothetical protein